MGKYLELNGLTDIFRKQTGFSEEELTAIALHLIHKSREAALLSDHHLYHVGSASLVVLRNGEEIIRTAANTIPIFLHGFSSHDKIAESNPTTHSEFPLLYEAPVAEYLFLGCNTPFCANCLKSAIMRGTTALFIDEDNVPDTANPTAEKSAWLKDRLELWLELCLPIALHAKIPIFTVNTHTGKIKVLVPGVPPEQRPKMEPAPARILDGNEVAMLQNNPDLFLSAARDVRAAIAVVRDRKTGKESFIFAEDAYPPGFSKQEGKLMEERFKDKHYRFPMDPLIQIMMLASRHGLELENGKIFANFVPSADRQIELAAAGVTDISFSDQHLPISESSKEAMTVLATRKAIKYRFVPRQQAISKLIENASINPGELFLESD